MYKYQEVFAIQLATEWLNGDRSGVRTKIRNLKNKAQAAFIASAVTLKLMDNGHGFAQDFMEYMHPNN